MIAHLCRATSGKSNLLKIIKSLYLQNVIVGDLYDDRFGFVVNAKLSYR